MNALKIVYDDLPAVVEMPKELQHQSVQIIITPLDEDTLSRKEETDKPTTWLANFAGKWQGETLVREDQGEYEDRDELK